MDNRVTIRISDDLLRKMDALRSEPSMTRPEFVRFCVQSYVVERYRADNEEIRLRDAELLMLRKRLAELENENAGLQKALFE